MLTRSHLMHRPETAQGVQSVIVGHYKATRQRLLGDGSAHAESRVSNLAD